jgi:hypothetical protein
MSAGVSVSGCLCNGLISPTIWNSRDCERRFLFMKGPALSCSAIILAAAAFGQTTAEKALPIQTPVCELANSSERFQGQFVTVRGRYDSNWERGAWIGADHCDKTLTFVLANGFELQAICRTCTSERMKLSISSKSKHGYCAVVVRLRLRRGGVYWGRRRPSRSS